MPKTRLSGAQSREPPLRTGDVARACGVTPDGVLHWIRSGKLRAFRTPGGHYRVRPDDLTALMRQTGSGPASPSQAGPSRILVVDDDQAVLSLLAELLRDQGYAVRTAVDTTGALEEIARHAPDLLLTDIALPGEGGTALTRALRADPGCSAVPVIAITGAFEDERLERIYAAGADLCLSKPFHADHLLGEIRRLLGNRRGGHR
jgi:excisionase family DNA binding protein